MSLASKDRETQQDELDALSSILDEETFELSTLSRPGEKSGTLVVNCTLPDPFFIQFHPDQQRRVEFLPPIFLRFDLPFDYPSISAPRFHLESIWMTDEQLQTVSNHLLNEWSENMHEPILFLWYSALGENALAWLNLSTTLDLTAHFPSTIIATEKPSTSIQLTSHQVSTTILDYEREKKRVVLAKRVLTCPVCLDEVYGSDCFICYGCSGTACKQCLKEYLETTIAEGQVKTITCPIDPKCNKEPSPTQIRSLVSEDMFQRYDRLLFQLSIDTMDDITYCPRCRQPVIVTQKENLGECATCYNVFCILCGRTYHGINPCALLATQMVQLFEDFKNASHAERLALEQKYGKIFQHRMDDMASMQTIRTSAKQCPKCSIYVDKLEGCNKMTCIKCQSYFCWTCQQLLSKTDPYGHFNRSGSRCYGKLFEGEDGFG